MVRASNGRECFAFPGSGCKYGSVTQLVGQFPETVPAYGGLTATQRGEQDGIGVNDWRLNAFGIRWV